MSLFPMSSTWICDSARTVAAADAAGIGRVATLVSQNWNLAVEDEYAARRIPVRLSFEGELSRCAPLSGASA